MAFYDIDGNELFNESLENKYPGLTDVYASLKRWAIPTTADNNHKAFPVFVHVTDLHGDSERLKNAVEVVNALGCDAMINTGDTVRFYSTDALIEPTGIASPYLITIGNHDSMGYTTEQAIYDKYIKPYATSNGYILDADVEYSTYYYRDFPSRKLRVFCLNDYQATPSTSPSTTKEMYQAQLNWFCDKLLETPSDYGVLCCYHSPERTILSVEGCEEFYKNKTTVSLKTPISDIVDAFISGTTISKTYAFRNTLTVSADFSTKNSGVEFIAHLTGHHHADRIGYCENTSNIQLMLNETCSCVWINKNQDGSDGTAYTSYNEASDISRIEGTKTENAFNVYTIDRENKIVKVVRIGSRLTTGFKPREHMIIPYAAQS